MGKGLIGQLQQSALGLLSRREYSRYELRLRLERFDADDAQLEQVLDRLQQLGYQSDQRYAECLLRSRIIRGQGAMRIAQELRHKGVADELGRSVMGGCRQDWFELARLVRERRFGSQPPEDRRHEAKQLRFLLYRGFSQDQCRYAISVVPTRD